MRILYKNILFFAFVMAASFSCFAKSIEEESIRIELVSEVKSIQPGQPFWVAVVFKPDPGWHFYWYNPGTAGLPTRIHFKLPSGFSHDLVQWPTPKIFELNGLVNYGYEGETLLMAEITPPEDLTPGEFVTLKANIDWVACQDVCLPGAGTVSLKLPVSIEPPQWDNHWKTEFDRTRLLWPQMLDTWDVQAFLDGGFIDFIIRPLDDSHPNLSDLYYFDDWIMINPNAPQELTKHDTYYQLRVAHCAIEDQLQGVIYNANGWTKEGIPTGLYVVVPLQKEDSALLNTLQSLTAPPNPKAPFPFSITTAIAFAFIGGLILNLMPCVFPILSIKALGFIHQSNNSPAKAKLHGLVFGLGVLMSFWALSGLLIALRAAGEQIGWGFQLQSPLFVSILATLMILIGLNLAGIFSFGTSFIGIGSRLSFSGYRGSFFSGVLATVVATPCTAPFMGTALGYALSKSAPISLSVFTFLGMGMALPYIILSFSPKLIRKLPKPGAWMESFKQAMSFPMFATALWLMWIFGSQTNINSLAILSFGLLTIALATWIYGRWCALDRLLVVRKRGLFFSVLLGILALYMIYSASEDYSNGEHLPQPSRELNYGIEWTPYSQEMVQELRKQGHYVFVDFTAAWCITCQANKKAIFSSDRVMEEFNRLNVVAVKADWTRRDPLITRTLESFGRNSIPFTLIYSPDLKKDPIILPTILTPQIVLDALEDLSARKD